MWIFYSFLMFLFSNLTYLAIRKAQKDGIPNSVYSITMFLIPSFAYFLISSATKTSLLLPLPHLALIILTAFLWSYLGNFFSLKGIQFAPNPGYSLVIQKSYVVLTTIGALVLFGSSISPQKVFGILVILAFTVLISIDNKTHKSQSKWVLFSFLAHLSFAFGSLMSKHFLNIGLQPYQYLFYITLFVGTLNLIETKKLKLSLNYSKQSWLIMIIIGLCSLGSNLSMQFGYKFAPNLGYVAAINTSSIMSLTIFSALIFKDSLSKQKILGIVGVLVGLLILTLSYD